MTIEELRRKLALPFNQNPSIEEMRAHGIELPRRHAVPPKAPPLPLARRDRPSYLDPEILQKAADAGEKRLADRIDKLTD